MPALSMLASRTWAWIRKDATMRNEGTAQYERSMADATWMMENCEQLEPTSALQQAASDNGIPYGAEMKKFVEWAAERLLDRTQ